MKESLNFMCLTETWQQSMDYIHLKEICPTGCSVFGTPRLSGCCRGRAVVYRDRFTCRMMNSDSFSSFELQMIEVGSLQTFYCILIYQPPGPAGVFLTEFNDLLSSIIKLEKVVMPGDLNLHIDDASCNMATEFITITESFNFRQHVSGPKPSNWILFSLWV